MAEESPPTLEPCSWQLFSIRRGPERDGNRTETIPPMEWDDGEIRWQQKEELQTPLLEWMKRRALARANSFAALSKMSG